MKKLSFVLFVALLLIGCEKKNEFGNLKTLSGTEWLMKDMTDSDIEVITIRFKDNKTVLLTVTTVENKELEEESVSYTYDPKTGKGTMTDDLDAFFEIKGKTLTITNADNEIFVFNRVK